MEACTDMEITFEEHDGMVRAVGTGELELESANACADKLIDHAIKTRASHFLVDCRRLEGVFTTLDRFTHTDYICEKILRAQANGKLDEIYLSVVASPPILDPDHFGETIARSRGIDVFVSERYSEAKAWLETEPAKKTNTSSGSD